MLQPAPAYVRQAEPARRQRKRQARPYATIRYFNGDMVSQRFVTKVQFEPVDPTLFTSAKIGKHK